MLAAEEAQPTFGSQSILDTCWTREELRGSPEDHRIRRSTPSEKGPPTRTSPIHSFSPLPQELRNSIRRVRMDKKNKVLALTFDLCELRHERTGYQADLVNYLREQHVAATFYAGGKWMRSHPEKAMQLMADPLFEVGNHAWTHGNLRVLSGQKMRDQIIWAQAQYELLWEALESKASLYEVALDEMQLIPRLPLTFRFPYGTCDAEALATLAQLGLPAIQWDVVTADPVKAQSARAITRAVLYGAKPGSIIICHANGRGYNTLEALQRIIPELRKQGYAFATVSQLLGMGVPVAKKDCYEMKPGDNLRYDTLFR